MNKQLCPIISVCASMFGYLLIKVSFVAKKAAWWNSLLFLTLIFVVAIIFALGCKDTASRCGLILISMPGIVLLAFFLYLKYC